LYFKCASISQANINNKNHFCSRVLCTFTMHFLKRHLLPPLLNPQPPTILVVSGVFVSFLWRWRFSSWEWGHSSYRMPTTGDQRPKTPVQRPWQLVNTCPAMQSGCHNVWTWTWHAKGGWGMGAGRRGFKCEEGPLQLAADSCT